LRRVTAEDGESVGAADEVPVVAYFEDAVEDKIDDVVGDVERRGRRQAAEQRGDVAADGFDGRRRPRLRNEQSVEVRVARQLLERLSLFGREIVEAFQLELRASAELHRLTLESSCALSTSPARR